MFLIMCKIEIIFSCLLLLNGIITSTEEITITLERSTSEHAMSKNIESNFEGYTIEHIFNVTTNFNSEVLMEKNTSGSRVISTITEGLTEVLLERNSAHETSEPPRPPQARGPPRFKGTAKEQQILDHAYNFFNYYYNPIVVIAGLLGEYKYLS